MSERTIHVDTTRSDPEALAEAAVVATNEPIPGGHPMEIWISYVLRIGVLTAGAIILVGLAWFLIAGSPSGPKTLNDVIGSGGHGIVVSPRTIVSGIAAANPTAIIQLGVLVLILTPMMRVLMTVFLFFAQRDMIFVAVTVIVFAVLVFGLVGFGS